MVGIGRLRVMFRTPILEVILDFLNRIYRSYN